MGHDRPHGSADMVRPLHGPADLDPLIDRIGEARFAINTWIRHMDDDGRTAEEVLEGFERWPTWMWANREVAELATWMRGHNAGRVHAQQVGFYGLDVYSLWDSLRAVMAYLAEHEPDAVDTARQAARCFEPYGEDPQSYAWASRMVPETCEAEVIAPLPGIG